MLEQEACKTSFSSEMRSRSSRTHSVSKLPPANQRDWMISLNLTWPTCFLILGETSSGLQLRIRSQMRKQDVLSLTLRRKRQTDKNRRGSVSDQRVPLVLCGTSSWFNVNQSVSEDLISGRLVFPSGALLLQRSAARKQLEHNKPGDTEIKTCLIFGSWLVLDIELLKTGWHQTVRSGSRLISSSSEENLVTLVEAVLR